LTCEECEKKFFRYLTKIDYAKHLAGEQKPTFCSTACRGLSQRNGKNKTCETCGKEFYVKFLDLKQRFCSIICTANWRKTAYRGKGNSNWKDGSHIPRPKNCINCGKEFLGIAESKYCNLSCVQRPQNGTDIERKFEQWLLSKAVPFKKQVLFPGVGIVDFLVGTTVVECDGIYWHTLPGAQYRDTKRDAKLVALGHPVIRLSSDEIEHGDLDYLMRFKGIVASMRNVWRQSWQ